METGFVGRDLIDRVGTERPVGERKKKLCWKGKV